MRTALILMSAAATTAALTACSAGTDAATDETPAAAVATATPTATPTAAPTPNPTSTPTSSPQPSASASPRPSVSAPSSAAPTPKPAAEASSSPKPKPSQSAVQPGKYVSYAEWDGNRSAYSGTVVLFFHADWCSKCRDTDSSAKAGMPSGLTLVKIDYDSARSLRQQYGVTVQHTFVQVDNSGKTLKKFVGTYDDNSAAWVKAQTV